MARAWAANRAFLLLGETGIGKSRLLSDFAASADGAVAIQDRPGDAGVTYAVLARLLRATLARHPIALSSARTQELALLLPELGTAVTVSGAAQRLLVQRTVETSLRDAAALGLRSLLIDDLHFADDASVDLLQSLVEADGVAELRWGLAQRPADARGASRQFGDVLAEGQRLETVALPALDVEQLAELVESLGLPELEPARLAPALLRHSGGNPLFALETLRDLVLSGDAPDGHGRLPQPSSVSALIERRLLQLSAPALKLARVAALAGGSSAPTWRRPCSMRIRWTSPSRGTSSSRRK